MTQPTPVLIVSDAVSAPTGLGRITRELAVRIAARLSDVCRVATLGYGGPGWRKLNFHQYAIEGMRDDWVLPTLPEVWCDWAGNEPGILLAIWDPSRLGWLSRPDQPEWGLPQRLKTFLGTAKFKRWIYAPLDAEGPHGRLAYPLTQALLGFDRILAYGRWGEDLIRASLGEEASRCRDLGSVPHGIDATVFYPRDRGSSRSSFFLHTGAVLMRGQQRTAILEEQPLIGTVATNQARKDWALWARCCALFLARHPQARFWIHTDVLERSWSIPQLLVDFGLLDRTVISLGYLEDDKMAQAYSACDLTLGIGAGEGFGFPVFESLFCGTPCIHGNYGGAPEHMDENLLVTPTAYRDEGAYCSRRPVFLPLGWANTMDRLLGKRVNHPGELDWNQVWPRFDLWFRQGLRG